MGTKIQVPLVDNQQVLQSIKDRPDYELIQTVMLRSMNQAVYSPENKGHFGLAYTAYAHFTSPIRRYPDLLVHRAIRYFVRCGKDSPNTKQPGVVPVIPQEKILPYDTAAMVALGEQCSMTERRADEATWDVVGWLKCEYMSDKIGDVFKGMISGVTNFGLFVELKDIYVEGLIHVSSLTSDYYHFDEVRHRLVGEKNGLMFGLGEEVTVRVAKVDLDDRKIDFELVEHQKQVRKKKTTRELLAEGKLGGDGSSGGRNSMGSRTEWDHKPARKKEKVNPRKGSQREALMRSAKKKDVAKPSGPKKKIVETKSPASKHQLSAAEQELMEFSGGGKGKSNKSKKRKVTAKPKLKGKQKGLKVKKPKR